MESSPRLWTSSQRSELVQGSLGQSFGFNIEVLINDLYYFGRFLSIMGLGGSLLGLELKV